MYNFGVMATSLPDALIGMGTMAETLLADVLLMLKWSSKSMAYQRPTMTLPRAGIVHVERVIQNRPFLAYSI